MKFEKFNSIENVKTSILNKIDTLFPSTTFVVQEKVHGANFSFITDGEYVRCGKRTSIIEEDEVFYNHNKLSHLHENVLKLSKLTKSQDVIVYGEICGGNYPHKDVENQGTKAIQKGIFYSSKIQFFAFDIKINGEYVDFHTFEKLCADSGIPYLPSLFSGTLRECVKFQNEYTTTIPNMLSLPQLDNNICEGNIIRPIEVLFFNNGSRVILKNKNSKFKEKKGNSGTKTYKETLSISDEVLDIINELELYITENRLRNVISKIGAILPKDFGKLNGLFAQDALEDFNKDNQEIIRSLSKEDKKVVTSRLNNKTATMIRMNLPEILDGEF